MKTKILLAVLIQLLLSNVYGQKPTIGLTFKARNSEQYISLDSIHIENISQNGDTVIYFPNNVILLNYMLGENETGISNKSFSISQNYPNPINGKTKVNLYLPEKDNIKITILNHLGRKVAQFQNTLLQGNHIFTFYPNNDKFYLLTVSNSYTSKSIKMINANIEASIGEKCKIFYSEYNQELNSYKSEKNYTGFSFNLGDELLMVGYNSGLESPFIDSPTVNKIYTFQFGVDLLCPGTPTVTYEGQVYNTVLIGSQCWLKENLNVGTMINGENDMVDNNIIEKYCYDNEPANCAISGGLYQWNEMMQYSNNEGVQGICPDGWHIPTDSEWKTLSGAVDSQFGIGDPVWDLDLWRGFDAGLNLKSTSGWYQSGNGTDIFGFTAIQGGHRSIQAFDRFQQFFYAQFWSSTYKTEFGSWSHTVGYNKNEMHLFGYNKEHGRSVRCIKDNNK